MSFEVNDGEGIQALYYNAEVKRENGWAVIEPSNGACQVTVADGTLGTGENTITIQSGSYLDGGDIATIPEQTLSVPEGSTDPRKDVMVINNQGDVERVGGYPEGKYPDSDDLLESERPAPSSLRNKDCVPLAILAIPQGATELLSSNILDIRRRAEFEVSQLKARSVSLTNAASDPNHAVREQEFQQHVSDASASYISGISLNDGSQSVSDITEVITGDNLTLDTGYSGGTVRVDAEGGTGDGGGGSGDGLYLGFVGNVDTETQTADGNSRQFTWQHGVSLNNPSLASVNVEPVSEAASTDFWNQSITETEIVIEYAAAPVEGELLEWRWEVWNTDSEGGVIKFADYQPVVEPSAPSEGWRMYTDSNDGSLKVKGTDGSVTTLISN